MALPELAAGEAQHKEQVSAGVAEIYNTPKKIHNKKRKRAIHRPEPGQDHVCVTPCQERIKLPFSPTGIRLDRSFPRSNISMARGVHAARAPRPPYDSAAVIHVGLCLTGPGWDLLPAVAEPMGFPSRSQGLVQESLGIRGASAGVGGGQDRALMPLCALFSRAGGNERSPSRSPTTPVGTGRPSVCF